MKVIKTFGQEKEDIAEFKTEVNQAIKKNGRVNFLEALFNWTITMIIGLSYVLTMIVGGQFIMKDVVTVGQLVTFVSYIGMLYGQCLRLDVYLTCLNVEMPVTTEFLIY